MGEEQGKPAFATRALERLKGKHPHDDIPDSLRHYLMMSSITYQYASGYIKGYNDEENVRKRNQIYSGEFEKEDE